ncbi:hypothetical protein J3F84DRAFT_355967, partial [Trichoderma pleuroticola]
MRLYLYLCLCLCLCYSSVVGQMGQGKDAADPSLNERPRRAKRVRVCMRGPERECESEMERRNSKSWHAVELTV